MLSGVIFPEIRERISGALGAEVPVPGSGRCRSAGTATCVPLFVNRKERDVEISHAASASTGGYVLWPVERSGLRHPPVLGSFGRQKTPSPNVSDGEADSVSFPLCV